MSREDRDAAGDGIFFLVMLLMFGGMAFKSCHQHDREQTFRECMKYAKDVSECSKLLP